MADLIRIEQLELRCCVGVPDEERANPQRLTVTLLLEPVHGFSGLDDEIANAVDYFAVAQFVKSVAAERPRRLIETLAEEIGAALLQRYPLAAVEVELRKYVLPDTAFVAVQLVRRR